MNKIISEIMGLSNEQLYSALFLVFICVFFIVALILLARSIKAQKAYDNDSFPILMNEEEESFFEEEVVEEKLSNEDNETVFYIPSNDEIDTGDKEIDDFYKTSKRRYLRKKNKIKGRGFLGLFKKKGSDE